jgi:CRP/FNR family cyclic AMP-dependent transcriptional regulator
MSIRDEVSALREVLTFELLDEPKLKLLAFVSELMTYKAGSIILKQGETGDAAFVLIDGLIDVSITSDDNSPFHREMGRHTFFGEIAVMKNTLRAATITAKTDIVVLKISKYALHDLIAEDAEITARILHHIEMWDQKTQ